MPTELQIPSHRTRADMLPIKIIGHLDGHITINHEAVALISDCQTSQSSIKLVLPSRRGINSQFLEHRCDSLHRRSILILVRLWLDDFKGFGLNSRIDHDYVSNANVAMLIAFLDHIKLAYKPVSQMGTMARR